MLLLLLCIVVVMYGYTRVTWRQHAVSVKTEYSLDSSKELRRELRVGAMNIAHARGHVPGGSNWTGKSIEERKNRLDKIAELIVEEDLDIVVLNEVDFDAAWSGHYDQAGHIAKRAKLSYVLRQRNFDISVPFFALRFGNAVLSRYPISDAKLIEYPVLKSWEKVIFGAKQGVICQVKLPEGESINIIPVHLEVRSEEIRKEAIGMLTKEMDNRTLLIGDFNSMPSKKGETSSAIDELLALGSHVAVQTGSTFPSLQPERRIDWIFYPKAWRELSQKVIKTELSDHAFVIAELNIVR